MLIIGKTTLLTVFIICVGAEKIPYDAYRGCPISNAEYKETIKKNTTFWCVSVINKPCDPNEAKRIDGSCNNLKNPARGTSHTPFYRILPAVYDTDDGGFEPRKASDGGPLPLARYLRTSLLLEGKVPDQTLTQLLINLLLFSTGDVITVQDSVALVLEKTYCCLPKGKTDPACTPNLVPDNDPVHRFSGIRCLNMTRPASFQSEGCIKNGTVPERIVSTTTHWDLSHLYGSLYESLEKMGRSFEGGLLKYEVEEGRIWPPSTKSKIDICLLNQKPVEKRCHATPNDGANTLLGVNLFSIWFWRNHNQIANALFELNPCWDDDLLFYTARDINIATMTQILYYELYPLIMGKQNLLRDKVISSSLGFRNVYNEKVLPQIALEFPYGLRWFHNMQEGTVKMYDQDGYYLREQPVVNLTLRTGFLAVDDNIDYLTQGCFRQGAAKADNVVDPDISENGMGALQRANDVTTNDLAKGRYFGFQPYVNYRKRCFGQSYANFDDLKDVFGAEKLEILRDRYKSMEDIELMAGMWLERHVEGGLIPETLYCILAEQLRRSVVSDRHWYESSERPYAFTPEQLSEIRKASISRFLCNVGDKVTNIQPKGFLRAGPRNKICSCEEIPKIDYSAWEDLSCGDDNYRKRK